MICTLTARKLKPGQADEFARTFDSSTAEISEELRDRWNHVYICRDVNDYDTLLSFGFFDGTLDELRAAQEESGRNHTVESAGDLVESILLDGSFEVIAEIQPQHVQGA